MFLSLLAVQLVSKANAIDEKPSLNFHLTEIQSAHWQTNLLLRPLLCEKNRMQTTERIFLSVLTPFDLLVNSQNLGILLIMHGGAIAHRRLTTSLMTLWAKFP